MLKRDVLCNKVKQNAPFKINNNVKKSAFFAEIVFFSQKYGIFSCVFLLKPSGRTVNIIL